MNKNEINQVTEATFDLGRKAVQTFSEFGAKTFTDMVDYTETVAKAQTNMFGYSPINTSALNDSWGKIQSDIIKNCSTWTDYLKNFSK